MFNQLGLVVFSGWLLIGGLAQANTGVDKSPPAATLKSDLSKGQQIASQVCAACHGTDGNSIGAANPHLAGQHSEYLVRQLTNFRSGLRKSAVMAPMATMLSEDDVRAVAAYFAKQTPKLTPVLVKNEDQKKRIDLGQAIYRGGIRATNVPACAGCHSPNGAGIPAQYPRLAGQFTDYTLNQLKAFKAGERGGVIVAPDANGKSREISDGQGAVMREISSRMTEDEMRAVAEYIAALH